MTDTIELKPLPWFRFNVESYLSGTMRLPTETHGAYLLLMLDYYGKAAPCPDDDFILAAVTRLPIEVWKKHRRVLEPFFDIREGHWFHKKIEAELLNGCLKHAASIEKATHAAHAKHEKRRAERDKSFETPAKGPRSAPSRRQAEPKHPSSMLEPCPSDAHLHKHNTTPYSRSISEDATTQVPNGTLKEEGIPIPDGFQPSEAGLAMALAEATPPEVDFQVRAFIAYNLNKRSLQFDWNDTWALWWARYVERRAKEAPPARVEVNTRPPEPSEAEYDRQIAFWLRGGAWSYKSFGPEPGSGGCRVPRAILEKHGILKPKVLV